MTYRHRQTNQPVEAFRCTPDTYAEIEILSGLQLEYGNYLVSNGLVFVVMDAAKFEARFRPDVEQLEMF